MNPPRMRGRSAMPRSRSKRRSKSRTRSKSRARSKSREAIDRLQQETVDSKTTLHASEDVGLKETQPTRSATSSTAEKPPTKMLKEESDIEVEVVVPTESTTWGSVMFSSFGNFGTSVGTTVNNEIGKFGDFLFNDKAAYLSSTPPQKVTRVLDTPAKSPHHKPISQKHKKKMDPTASRQKTVYSKPVLEKEKISKADDHLMDYGPEEPPMDLQPRASEMNEESDYGPEPHMELASRVSLDMYSVATVQIANTSGKEKEQEEITSQDIDPAMVRPRGILGAFRRMKSFGRGQQKTPRSLAPVIVEKAELTVLEPEVFMQTVPRKVPTALSLPKGTTQFISIDAVKEILSERYPSVHVFEPCTLAGNNSRVLPRQGLKSITPSNLQKWLRFAQQRISLHRQQADESPILMSTPTRSTKEGNFPVRTSRSSDQKPITKAPHEIFRVVSPKIPTGRDPEKKRAASAKKKTISRKNPSLCRESKMVPYLATRGNPSSLSQY